MSDSERIIEGTGVSPGIAVGPALKLDSRNRLAIKIDIAPDRVEEEVARFERAIVAARGQLETLKCRLEEMVGREHGYIVDAHLLRLDGLWAAAGHPNSLFPLTPDELVRMTNGRVTEVGA